MRTKVGRPIQHRIRLATSEKLRQLLIDMGIPLRELARGLNKRERWLEDAFTRRDRNTGGKLPLLETYALAVLMSLRGLDWRAHRGLFGTFAEIDAEVRHSILLRDENYQAVTNAVPLLIMDNAVEDFADEFLRYLKARGVEARPRRQVIVDFFTRVPQPKAEPRFSYLELCAGMFDLKARERARRIRISPDAFEKYDEYERPVRITKVVAIFPLLRMATPVEVRRAKRDLVRRRNSGKS